MPSTATCPKCDREISNLALTCPLCGARTERALAEAKLKNEEKRGKEVMRLLMVIMALAMGWVAWNMLGDIIGVSRLGEGPPASSSEASPASP